MDITGSPLPCLHTCHLDENQRRLCNRNLTYEARIADLETLRNELQQIRGLFSDREAGKLPGSAKGSLMKRKRTLNGKKGLESQQTVVQRDVYNEKANDLEGAKVIYRDLERSLLEWDDQCASLAESLISRPKVSKYWLNGLLTLMRVALAVVPEL